MEAETKKSTVMSLAVLLIVAGGMGMVREIDSGSFDAPIFIGAL